MKRLIMFLFAALVSVAAFAQTPATFTAEDLAKLGITSEKINELTAEKKIDQKLETYGKWAGLGKEIGTAVNESVTSLTATAVDFSKTELGRFTMFLVAYKVIGADILQIVFGVLWVFLVLFASWFVHYNYGKNKRYCSREKVDENGKVVAREYAIKDGDSDFQVTATVMLIVGLLATIPIILV